MATKTYDVLKRIGRDEGLYLPGDQVQMDEREASFYVDNDVLKVASKQAQAKDDKSKTTNEEG